MLTYPRSRQQKETGSWFNHAEADSVQLVGSSGLFELPDS